MNGQGTDDFLDRDFELDAYERLSAGGICPTLLAKFTNGIVMQLIEGVVFTGDSVKAKSNARLTAREIARMHKNVGLRDSEREASLVDSVKHFLSLVKEHTIELIDGDYKLVKTTDSTKIIQFFEEDFAYAQSLIAKQSSPLVVCHNDLLLANFLHDTKNDKVTIIDYEYLAPNPAAFDLANHFNEYAGTEVVSFSVLELFLSFQFDFDNIPGEEYQKWWLTEYLPEFLEETTIPQTTVDQWMKSIKLMAPLSHLLWGTWALMQLEKSAIDFDYANYAMDRLKCYFQLKKDLETSSSDTDHAR